MRVVSEFIAAALHSKSPLHKRMEAESAGEGVVAPVGPNPLPPGHEHGTKNPKTQAGLKAWMQTLGGKLRLDVDAYTQLLEDNGIECLRDLNLTEDEYCDMGMPRAISVGLGL